MKLKFAVLIVVLVLIVFGFKFYHSKNMNKNITLTVGDTAVASPVGTVSQSWDGDTLKISVVAETQSCGGVTWAPSYEVMGDTIKVIAKGKGDLLNCPPMNVYLNFSIPKLPKKDYKIVPNISIDWKNSQN